MVLCCHCKSRMKGWYDVIFGKFKKLKILINRERQTRWVEVWRIVTLCLENSCTKQVFCISSVEYNYEVAVNDLFGIRLYLLCAYLHVEPSIHTHSPSSVCFRFGIDLDLLCIEHICSPADLAPAGTTLHLYFSIQTHSPSSPCSIFEADLCFPCTEHIFIWLPSRSWSPAIILHREPGKQTQSPSWFLVRFWMVRFLPWTAQKGPPPYPIWPQAPRGGPWNMPKLPGWLPMRPPPPLPPFLQIELPRQTQSPLWSFPRLAIVRVFPCRTHFAVSPLSLSDFTVVVTVLHSEPLQQTHFPSSFFTKFFTVLRFPCVEHFLVSWLEEELLGNP